ncbi:U-box domain-containing protein 7-like [Miscanthus floridulus]|uniref:U-box domain-containing protein 7-like n=1 Tax=Miscanthus floridulus TaxID=154761 RepID=UPI003459B40F
MKLKRVKPVDLLLAATNLQTCCFKDTTKSMQSIADELLLLVFRNKVHIVKAGLLKKLPQLTDEKDLSRSQELALLVLSISSLANTDSPLSTTELLPFLVATLSAADVPSDTKLPCLAALRNLSKKLEHARDVVSSGAVRALLSLSLSLSLDRKTSEAVPCFLGELAARKAMEEEEGEAAARAVLEAMTRHESARCQEHATYLAMVLAHGSRALRSRMRQLGVVQALLEVSLLGSPLAQRRAAKILQWFKEEGPQSSRIRAHSSVRAPRRRGDSRIRFFLLRRPPEQYAVTSTNHARPLELVPATELASAAALAPTVALVPASPAGEEAARSHCTRPPRPAALHPGRAAAAPAHPAAQPRVRALPPETRRREPPPPAPSPMCFGGVEEQPARHKAQRRYLVFSFQV